MSCFGWWVDKNTDIHLYIQMSQFRLWMYKFVCSARSLANKCINTEICKVHSSSRVTRAGFGLQVQRVGLQELRSGLPERWSGLQDGGDQKKKLWVTRASVGVTRVVLWPVPLHSSNSVRGKQEPWISPIRIKHPKHHNHDSGKHVKCKLGGTSGVCGGSIDISSSKRDRSKR